MTPLLIVYIIMLSISKFATSLLSLIQQNYVRSILSNPSTPYMIKIKTQNIVYDNYIGWANAMARNATYIKSPDLTQCVSTGLLKAIRKYDWKRQTPTHFANYAKKYIMGEVYLYTKMYGKIRREIQFVAPVNQWIFDRCPKKNEQTSTSKSKEIQKNDILCLLDPEERRLFEYVYGGLFTGEKGRSISQVCDLMTYGNEETYRIRKIRLIRKILQNKNQV
jgi:hypothetical protein